MLSSLGDDDVREAEGVWHLNSQPAHGEGPREIGAPGSSV